MKQKIKQVNLFLESLEQYVIETGEKRRILDSIKDIKADLKHVSTEQQLQHKLQEIDEAVNYLKNKIAPKEEMIVTDDGTNVSEEEIQQEIQKIMNSCGETNYLIRSRYNVEQETYIKETEQKMRDLANVNANYDIVTIPTQFTGHMYQMGQNYDRQINNSTREYITEAGDNFNRAMQKIKNLLGGLNYRNKGLTQKEIYQNWDEKLEYVKQSQIKEAERTEKGAQLLSQFGEKHVDPIQKIVKKKKRKRVIYKLFPLIIVLAILIINIAGQAIQNAIEPKAETQSEASPVEFMEKVPTKQIINGLRAIPSSILSGAISFVQWVIIVVIIVVVLLILAWFFWNQHVKKLYRKWICNDVGQYLSKEIENFWRDNSLRISLEDGMGQIEDSVETQYKQLFAKAFWGMNQSGNENSQEIRLLELYHQWNDIKNTIIGEQKWLYR